MRSRPSSRPTVGGRADGQRTARLRSAGGGDPGSLRAAGETVTEAEVAAQRLRDQADEAEVELHGVAERLGLDGRSRDAAEQAAAEPLREEQIEALRARVQRLHRRREQLGPVNPLAQDEYSEAVAHVEEMEAPSRRSGDRASRAALVHPRHRSSDRADLPADLRGGRAQLRGARERRLPGRDGPPAAGQRRAAGRACSAVSR